MPFHYIPIASRLHDSGSLSGYLARYKVALQETGGRPAEGTVTGSAFFLILTGGTEQEVLRRYHSCQQQGQPGSLLMIAHSAHNSLPAAMEILAQVRQEGGSGRIYLLRGPDDFTTLDQIRQTALCLEANRRLSEDRLGRVGESSDWLVASSHLAEIVFARYGLRIISIAMEDLRARIAREPVPETGPEYAIWERAAGVEGITRETFTPTVRIYRALKELITVHKLSGVTLRCFDLVLQDRTTGCLALSRLADEGITAGCEGDIPSVVLLRWLWHLTRNSGWMANPADVNVLTGEVLLAHCTVPLSLTDDYHLQTHFESGLGIGIAGTLKPGPVTLLRLGGKQLDQWWGAEGQLAGYPHGGQHCRTQALIQIPSAGARNLLEAPLGNHLVLIPGHVREMFAEAFQLNLAQRPIQKGFARPGPGG